MTDLQIIVDAEVCADNIWWDAHDKKDWTAVSAMFQKTEEIISKYASNKPNLPAAAENLVAALQKYNTLTMGLAEGSSDATGLHYPDMCSLLAKMCANLGIHPLAGNHTASWWYNWAQAEVARKTKGSGYERAMDAVFNNLSDEHKVRFGFDSITSDMLAHQMQAAGLLSHSLKGKELAYRQLITYYATLFALLSEKK
ncbi:MAG: hypothetical protein AABX75_01090 [Nanoarchaeota archaeon]